MFTFMDKALVSTLVSFVAGIVANRYGIDFGPEWQAALVAVLTGLATYRVPNKA